MTFWGGFCGFWRRYGYPCIGESAKTSTKLQLQLRANGHSNSGKSDPFCMAECSHAENSPRIQNLHDDRFVHLAETQCTSVQSYVVFMYNLRTVLYSIYMYKFHHVPCLKQEQKRMVSTCHSARLRQTPDVAHAFIISMHSALMLMSGAHHTFLRAACLRHGTW